jgi:eukaryotic-like serine/threonine-protein kinase
MINALTLRVVRGMDVGTEHRLPVPAACVIGRDASCNLRLAQRLMTETLSRHHCRIDVGPEGAFVRDLNSRNGTFVNGTKIGQRSCGRPVAANPEPGPRHDLADGDRLRIGEIEFGVGIVSSDAPRKASNRYAGSVC